MTNFTDSSKYPVASNGRAGEDPSFHIYPEQGVPSHILRQYRSRYLPMHDTTPSPYLPFARRKYYFGDPAQQDVTYHICTQRHGHGQEQPVELGAEEPRPNTRSSTPDTITPESSTSGRSSNSDTSPETVMEMAVMIDCLEINTQRYLTMLQDQKRKLNNMLEQQTIAKYIPNPDILFHPFGISPEMRTRAQSQDQYIQRLRKENVSYLLPYLNRLDADADYTVAPTKSPEKRRCWVGRPKGKILRADQGDDLRRCLCCLHATEDGFLNQEKHNAMRGDWDPFKCWPRNSKDEDA